MSELVLKRREEFDGVELDCYVEAETSDSGDFWLTREQIGRALEYVQPEVAITKIHQRNAERMDKFSTVTKMVRVEGSRTVTREVTVYSFKGLLEICRYSNQPKANAVMDKLWEIADEIRRTGSYNANNTAIPDEPLNVRARIAEVLQRLALQVTDETQKEAITRKAYEYATGEELPKKESKAQTPTGHRYWTSSQIGKTLKWPADAVITRAKNLGITDNPANGIWDGDIWSFSKEGRQKFLDLVNSGVVKIEDGYEYYENGFCRKHWSFDASRARI